MSHLAFRIGTCGIPLLALLFSACAITGLDGTSNYACKAPEGIKCDSVAGTYHNAVQNNLPSQRRSSLAASSAAPSTPSSPVPTAKAFPTMLTTALPSGADEPLSYAGTPLRASPKVLRLWIKSWEDADRDLNGESLVYVQVDGGRWLVDHVQRQSREAFAPVRPSKVATAPKSAPAADRSKAITGGTSDDASSITQAVRALQGRAASPSDN
jgi:conjugal transfer pilus assembly protein TraV